MATWLAVLSHKDCVYLPEALSCFRLHEGQDQNRGLVIRIQANVEWLQLFCDAHDHKIFLAGQPGIHSLLTSKLVTCIAFLSSVHDEVPGACDVEKIQAVVRQALGILLGK